MKNKFLVSILFFSISLSILLFAVLPFRFKLNIPYTIKYIALAIIVISFIYGQIIIYPRKIKEYKLISTTLTSIYKFYLPVIFITFFLTNTSWIILDIFPGKDITLAYGLDLLFIIWLALGIRHMKSKLIYISKKHIKVSNYFSIKEYSIEEIRGVNRFFILNMYIIIIEKESEIIKLRMLPKISESTIPFITPESIKILKSYINKNDKSLTHNRNS